ncbi:hypothetical protein KDL01_20315 [Actinospica durhamensis]|uniref:Transposase (putative) YhgA-like domain-containing protein n=1 Tax=Actinospica durhamensis TaxID=1508375 RepID=A0A941IUJ3_9ACTN|nr:hypothetical protein [Actinospica durhamensis]MBR7835631.1 hypothetical protein [Actinospica durhamensis]
MVTSTHETLHRFFRDHPETIDRTFHAVGMTNFPKTARVQLLPNDVTEIEPLERRVDTAMLVESVDGQVFILVFESQGKADEAKRLSWPYYVEYLHSRHGCPVVLVVVCQNPSTAAWAREPIVHEAAFWLTSATYPLVLGPENVPSLKDIPESELLLGVLSAVIHGDGTDASDLARLAKNLRRLDPQTRVDLATYVLLGLGSFPIAQSWMKMMNVDYETLRTSPIIREWLDAHDQELTAEAEAQGKAQGLAEGRAEGLAEGRVQGLAEGMVEGMAKAKAESILHILDKRSVELSGLELQKIYTSTDLDQLDRWLDAALGVTSADELFGRRPRASDTP